MVGCGEALPPRILSRGRNAEKGWVGLDADRGFRGLPRCRRGLPPGLDGEGFIGKLVRKRLGVVSNSASLEGVEPAGMGGLGVSRWMLGRRPRPSPDVVHDRHEVALGEGQDLLVLADAAEAQTSGWAMSRQRRPGGRASPSAELASPPAIVELEPVAQAAVAVAGPPGPGLLEPVDAEPSMARPTSKASGVV
jgi:hypothetical protein